jgi:ureidoglycolate lyase
MKFLKVEPLSAEAFAPFGNVIEAGQKQPVMINEGTTERYHGLAKIDVSDNGGQPLLNIFRGTPRPQPIEIRMMEKHPLGSQAFMPLFGQDFYVVVAKPSDELNLDDLRCFLAKAGQGVNYAKGVWHHPLLVLDNVNDFLVIDRGGEGNNLIEVFFEKSDFVYVPEQG